LEFRIDGGRERERRGDYKIAAGKLDSVKT